VDVLYVAPHSDDVAFSAAGQVARDVSSGARVAVLTLFEAPAGQGPASFSNQAARRAEDDRYAALAGVTRLSGGWPDAVARRRRYRTPRLLFSPMGADEQPLVEEVRARLQSLVDGGCRRLVAPLGVGQHVDHQIAHAAARGVGGADLRYYEDTPYVLTRYQLPRRLARLALRPTGDGDATLARGTIAGELGAAARAWYEAPLLEALVGPRMRALAVAAVLPPEILYWPRRAQAACGPVAAEVLDGPEVGARKLEAIACYGSQWPLFYPSLDAWRAALTDYAARMGRGQIVERCWTITEAQASRAGNPASRHR
jgi:LmbE family N-acetylglucosaminyl deacetylase